MSFGKRLFTLRKEKNISQEELGGYLNVSRQTISKWELGETTPEMEKLILMSEFFNVSLDELIKGEKSELETPEQEKSGQKTSESKKEKNAVIYALKIVGMVIGALVFIEVLVMAIYFLTNGFPPL